MPTTNKGLNDQARRPYTVSPGEKYIAAFDCTAIMARGQTRLYDMLLPVRDDADVTIIETLDPADPQHGVAANLAKFQFEVAERATLGKTVSIIGEVQSTEFSKTIGVLKVSLVAAYE